MPKVSANGIDVEVEEFGDERAPALLLVMGLGAQLIHWDEPFCRGLAERGFRVVRFDNRDAGLSTWLDDHPTPDPLATMAAVMRGDSPAVPYRLSDMAADAVGVLDALGIECAHVAGASMGGMIAQTMAVEHGERVRSLTSIMSTTGEADLPPAAPAAMQALLQPAPEEREAYLEHHVATWRVLGSPGFPRAEEEVRERGALAYDRAFHPVGARRQLAAIVVSGGRREALRRLELPALVIHGEADTLVPLEGGLDTAEALRDAELLRIEGMGHELPEAVWGRVQDAIEAVARRAGAPPAPRRTAAVRREAGADGRRAEGGPAAV